MGKAKSGPRTGLNTYALLFAVIALAALLTHVIPGGAFDRVVVSGRTVVDADTFHAVDASPATFFDVFRAFPYGLLNASLLVMGVIMLGGSTKVILGTGVIHTGIAKMVDRLEGRRADVIVVAVFCFFAVLGGFLGLIDISIAFVPLTVAVAAHLGYDRLTGVAMPLLGALSGFIAGPTNPMSTAICQAVAEIPIFSGLWLRLFAFFAIVTISLIYLLRHAHRYRSRAVTEPEPGGTLNLSQYGSGTLGVRGALVLLLLFGSIALFVAGSLRWSWTFADLCGILFFDAVAMALLFRTKPDTFVRTFLAGAADMMGAAALIGLAAGIEWILSRANILDTIVHALFTPAQSVPPALAVVAAFLIVAAVNFPIPSASGKAVLIMPLLVPLAQVIGFSEQTATLIYQFGDGVTKICFPTVGPVLAVLAIGGIPFSRWFRYAMPLVFILSLLCVALLVFSFAIQY